MQFIRLTQYDVHRKTREPLYTSLNNIMAIEECHDMKDENGGPLCLLQDHKGEKYHIVGALHEVATDIEKYVRAMTENEEKPLIKIAETLKQIAQSLDRIMEEIHYARLQGRV